ncbi:MAG: hypothetical protein NTV15_00855 [Candidatus Bathyarchaeota archaeon]|nr:hypothetical protein [Candidatus Bathyarchaeota archaeon]
MLDKVRRSLRKVILSLPASWAERILSIAGYRRIVLFRIRGLRARLLFVGSANRYVTDTNLYYIDPRRIVYAMSSAVNCDHEKGDDNEFDAHNMNPMRKGPQWEQVGSIYHTTGAS